MSIFKTINELKEEFDKFQAIEWTTTSMIVVVLIIFYIYRKTIILVFRVVLEPINVYKYFFDKSVSFDGETFLLSINNSVSIDEAKQLKRYESLTRIKIYRNNEKSSHIKLCLETSLSDVKVDKRDSHLLMKNDTPESLTIRLSNATFDGLFKTFNEKDMHVFINFTAYKSLTVDFIDYYNFSSLDFQILEVGDFKRKFSVMMFEEYIEPELAKIKATEEVNQ